jgi:UDPglucose 6-dehydrogenase
MENAYLATKVTFCNEFFRIAEKLSVNYEDIRELITLDPRIDSSHTFVYRD